MNRQLSVKSKLLATVLGVSIASIVVVGIISFTRGQQAINAQVLENLTARRESRAELVQRYIQSIDDQVATLSQDRSTSTAAAEFVVAAEQLNLTTPDPEWKEPALAFYKDFVARLPSEDSEAIRPEQYLPSTALSRHLQHYYIMENPGSARSNLDVADDDSFYSRVHERFHPSFRNFTDRFGYYDLFIIEPDKKEIIYSVQKKVDFGTSLASGPWGRSNLADLVDQVLSNPVPGSAAFTDYEFYRPSNDEPAAFAAAPIFNPIDQRLLGVLAFQLPVDEINDVMTSNENWSTAGFGETGEAFLVGPDGTMRSQSRLLAEAPLEFRTAMREGGGQSSNVSQILASDNTVLRQTVATASAQRGLLGQTGTAVVRSYHGGTTLSTYAPLDLPAGLDWAIISEQALAEAEEPVNSLQRALLTATGLIVLALTAMAMFMSARLIRPVNALISWTERISAGELEAQVPVTGHDEIGQLAISVDRLVVAMRTQSETIEVQTAEMESLVLNLMPAQIAERVANGESNIADAYPNVTIVVAKLTGFSRYARHASPGEAKELLDEVIGSFDDVAGEAGVEKISGGSSGYIAACGLLEPRLDQRQRAMHFAVGLDQKLEALSNFNKWELGLQIGVAAGDVEAGIVGTSQISFEVWGDPVSDASALADAAPVGSVMVGREIEHSLNERFPFIPAAPVDVDGQLIEAWIWNEGPD